MWTAGEACREARCWILDEGHILWLNNLLCNQPRLERVQKEVGAKERSVEAINQLLDTHGSPCIRWSLWKMPRILQCTEIAPGLRQVWGLLNCQQQSQQGKHYLCSSKHSKKGEGNLTSKWTPENEHWDLKGFRVDPTALAMYPVPLPASIPCFQFYHTIHLWLLFSTELKKKTNVQHLYLSSEETYSNHYQKRC